MEGLHCALSTAVSSNLIHGINLGSPDLTLSHLFYGDDVIITTEWNPGDLDNIIRVLHVFYLASGLKININKSNIYGIGVSDDEVSNMARNSGCAAGSFPFTYLGLPIGSTMNRGLNIGSLKSFNLALLQSGFGDGSFSRMPFGLRSLRRFMGKKATLILMVASLMDIWISDYPLTNRYNRLYRLELDKDCLIIDRIENGQWRWNWSRNDLEVRNTAYFRDLLIEIIRVDISTVGDTCIWCLAKDDIFSVKEARRVIDDKILPSLATSTSWDKTLPRKSDVWKTSSDHVEDIFHIRKYEVTGKDITRTKQLTIQEVHQNEKNSEQQDAMAELPQPPPPPPQPHLVPSFATSIPILLVLEIPPNSQSATTQSSQSQAKSHKVQQHRTSTDSVDYVATKGYRACELLDLHRGFFIDLSATCLRTFATKLESLKSNSLNVGANLQGYHVESESLKDCFGKGSKSIPYTI
ncbi:hypothetical protein Tco_1066414 [Tanacetum coccineum]|uniref:Uncharacterized protein n=1 Tax=Tanacetum coccineum TaxID=301880 RepID=A0ABQ5HBR3_9ASTR